MEIVWSDRALRHLRQLPKDAAIVVLDTVEALAEDRARTALEGRKLKRRAGYRIHVGAWRVIVAASRERLTIIDVGHRGTIYDR